jgi:hypothetical protein
MTCKEKGGVVLYLGWVRWLRKVFRVLYDDLTLTGFRFVWPFFKISAEKRCSDLRGNYNL